MLLEKLRQIYSNDVEKLGVILADGSVIELQNIHEEPENGALMKSQDVFDYLYSGEHETVALWHTHVKGATADLSGEDYGTFLLHPDMKQYIVSATEIKMYYVEAGEVHNG